MCVKVSFVIFLRVKVVILVENGGAFIVYNRIHVLTKLFLLWSWYSREIHVWEVSVCEK